MEYKKRNVPVKLQFLRSLLARSQLSTKDKSYYENKEKGFEGEQQFDDLLSNLTGEFYILHDVSLECNNTSFQIDTIVICAQTIYLFEVKNYQGEFYLKNEGWFSATGNAITNPIHQVHRSENLFRQWIHPLKLHFSIQSQIVFIHPEFTLLADPRNLPIILPTQINQLLKKISSTSSKLMAQHKILVDRLIASHISQSPYMSLPTYEYEKLQKGILCPQCHCFMNIIRMSKVKCPNCSRLEHVDTAILRSINEFQLLFPSRTVTVTKIVDWCQIINSKKQLEEFYRKI